MARRDRRATVSARPQAPGVVVARPGVRSRAHGSLTGNPCSRCSSTSRMRPSVTIPTAPRALARAVMRPPQTAPRTGHRAGAPSSVRPASTHEAQGVEDKEGTGRAGDDHDRAGRRGIDVVLRELGRLVRGWHHLSERPTSPKFESACGQGGSSSVAGGGRDLHGVCAPDNLGGASAVLGRPHEDVHDEAIDPELGQRVCNLPPPPPTAHADVRRTGRLRTRKGGGAGRQADVRLLRQRASSAPLQGRGQADRLGHRRGHTEAEGNDRRRTQGKGRAPGTRRDSALQKLLNLFGDEKGADSRRRSSLVRPLPSLPPSLTLRTPRLPRHALLLPVSVSRLTSACLRRPCSGASKPPRFPCSRSVRSHHHGSRCGTHTWRSAWRWSAEQPRHHSGTPPRPGGLCGTPHARWTGRRKHSQRPPAHANVRHSVAAFASPPAAPSRLPSLLRRLLPSCPSRP